MKKLKLAILILVGGILITSCQSQTKEQQLTQKEKELLQRENDLLKKELGQSDSTIPNPTIDQFSVDKALVKKIFLQYLPNISDGRKLNSYTVDVGDLNGDNLIDAIVDYGLEPTSEDNGGGGNAIGEISGLVAFTNTGNKLVIADHSEEFGGNFGARNQLKEINNGVIFLEGLDYSEDDPRCCPSLKTTTKLILRNNKLTQLK
ncbi:hypothetical protein [Ferruginibacter sp.]|uniref:hypothetical protein n=1 Tax=Ferruginibacter sp. TaxID=1940288 RepID=UPI0019B403DA|nr:hypothetical protein [Ferruginibacter sp.]MBC7627867.1 hypothetical protein [Ferruginibacter sp.]